MLLSMEMTTTPAENRKLPAWIGSILFHAVLLLLVLLWFSFPSDANRGTPGERAAIGSIVLQPSGGGQQQAADSSQQTADGNLESLTAELAQMTDINLSNLPTTTALSPGREQNVSQPSAASAANLAESLQHSISSGSGIGNQTGDTTVRVFGQEGTGSKFMYVFDHSGSMDGTPLRAAKRELIQSLDSLGDLHQFNIIFFNHSMRTWQLPERGRQLSFATEQNKQNAVRFVESMMAEGGTSPREPLLAAIAYRPDVIFFLTDGEDLTPAHVREIERANSQFGRKVQINVIEFGGGGFMDRASRLLQQLAEQNYGQYGYVNVLMLR